MNRDDVIRWAREAELINEFDATTPWIEDHDLTPYLERFAVLVAAAAKAEEREACAKVVEASPSYDWHRFACEAAAAIRARKENT